MSAMRATGMKLSTSFRPCGSDGQDMWSVAAPIALTALEDALAVKKVDAGIKRAVVEHMDSVLGFDLFGLARTKLRVRPKDAHITEEEIEDALARRKAARAEKDFATSDAIRDELAAKGVEVMDGDPLGWEWKLN